MMKSTKGNLTPLSVDDREQFILDNQESFRYGAMEEFGLRDSHTGEDGEIISRDTMERSIDAPDSEAYRIMLDGKPVGGVVLKINTETKRNELELLFVSLDAHSKGIGYSAWKTVEALHPETEGWETYTPYFEKRNIHFLYRNRGRNGQPSPFIGDVGAWPHLFLWDLGQITLLSVLSFFVRMVFHSFDYLLGRTDKPEVNK